LGIFNKYCTAKEKREFKGDYDWALDLEEGGEFNAVIGV